MEITAKELRGKPTQIIEQASRGTEIVITVHGKKMAKLIPYGMKDKNKKTEDDAIFGIWKDQNGQESVNDYVRSIRKRRSF
jgi:prevent-host-death family protein